MERFLATLVICVSAAVVSAGYVCESDNYEKLTMINGQTEKLPFPCKYWGLKNQKCGDYVINLSPGILWLADDYRLNTVWMGVHNATDKGQDWQGRTNNKIIVKFLNDGPDKRDLFRQKGGTVNTSTMFDEGIDPKGGAYVEDKGRNFRLTLFPWHPRRYRSSDLKKYSQSTFKFECNHDAALSPYPDQMCGNATKNVVEYRAREVFNLRGSIDVAKRITIYHDLFMNEDVTQMDEKCIAAVDILKTNCSGDTQRVLTTLRNCEGILGTHTECVTQYSCHPMDVFNACLRWGCGGDEPFHKSTEEPCMETGMGIDMCPDFQSVFGNLTARMKAAKCYKDFLALDQSR